MTDEQTALSRRAVACKGFRWLPGMMRLRATPPSRRDHLRGEGRVPDGGDTWEYENWPVIPDVSDAATLGCLLALVREAYPDAYTVPQLDPEEVLWYVVTASGAAWSNAEAGALVAALESAP